MRAIFIIAVTASLLLSGCDAGSERTGAVQPHREGKSLSEERVSRDGDMDSVRKGVVDGIRQSPRSEQSLLLTMVFSWWWWVLYYGVGVIVGIFVYRDAKTRPKLAMNIRPFWWCAITILDAPLGVLVYWVSNHSNLRTKQDTHESNIKI